MFGLAQGVSNIVSVLPDPVYALLSGLNAATVGLIALAGMQLSTQTITDGITRTILIGSACAGLLYTALWYFPVLMVICALLVIIWDLWAQEKIKPLCERFNRRRQGKSAANQPPAQANEEGVRTESSRTDIEIVDKDIAAAQVVVSGEDDPEPPHQFTLTPRQGIIIILAFFAVFITLMVLRATLVDAPVDLRLFTNLFLAGTIIFGGGPVVIPLLREYVVAEGWVTSRDFLIGLAIIQAFPGPNFNCESRARAFLSYCNFECDPYCDEFGGVCSTPVAVYLATLAAKYTSCPRAVTALLGLLGIFSPGIILSTGFQSLWRHVRRWRAVKAALRGLNAAAVGLIWTAVYRLWAIGYLRGGGATSTSTGTGTSLDQDPWYLVIAALAFCGTRWYRVPAPVAIVLGGVLGLVRFAVVGRY